MLLFFWWGEGCVAFFFLCDLFTGVGTPWEWSFTKMELHGTG